MKCPCEGTDEMCPCQNRSIPQNFTVPDRFMVWHSMPNLSHIGTWTTERYPEEAVEAVRADTIPAMIAEAREDGRREGLYRLKGIVDDCCFQDSAGNVNEIDHREFERRFYALLDAEAPEQPRPDALQEAAKVLLDAMEKREWAFYPIEMPVNEKGYGPATVGADATSIIYEVWEAVTLRSVSSHEALPDAITATLRALAGGDSDD